MKVGADFFLITKQFTHPHKAKKIVEIFLTTPFSKEARHSRRVEKIEKLER